MFSGSCHEAPYQKNQSEKKYEGEGTSVNLQNTKMAYLGHSLSTTVSNNLISIPGREGRSTG